MTVPTRAWPAAIAWCSRRAPSVWRRARPRRTSAAGLRRARSPIGRPTVWVPACDAAPEHQHRNDDDDGSPSAGTTVTVVVVCHRHRGWWRRQPAVMVMVMDGLIDTGKGIVGCDGASCGQRYTTAGLRYSRGRRTDVHPQQYRVIELGYQVPRRLEHASTDEPYETRWHLCDLKNALIKF